MVPLLNRYSLISGIVTIGALGTALGFSIWTLRSVILNHDLNFDPLEWLEDDTPTNSQNT